MRSLMLLILAAFCLPACTVVVVPAEPCDHQAGSSPEARYQISGSSYSSPSGGWSQVSTSWQGAPPTVRPSFGTSRRRNESDIVRLEPIPEGPFRRRNCR